MNNLEQIKQLLEQSITLSSAIFFKTGPGGYAEHDKFMGVTVPALRIIAKKFKYLLLSEIQQLLESAVNEHRQLALFILVDQYNCGDAFTKEKLYQFYLKNIKYVNNWNLVDLSAHLIIGVHLLEQDKAILLSLSTSPVLWERRVAIVSTWWFIRKNQFDWTVKIATMLLHDSHDLIHKSVGWMLREMGKRDVEALRTFLAQHASSMPRTMLRYAIEKFSPEERAAYLRK